MPLPPGTRLGAYEVIAQIGEGGMGQVYRARDAGLNRDVALKILPDGLGNDPDRLARFTREAQTLASLNHPNIVHIHGLEESGSVRALAMELVEGEDLAHRIARGAIPVDEALAIARQIADALEAAHEQGITHRDLKPANIMVRADGTVKVLDFGLAKATDPAASSANMAMSPTITSPALTEAGMILGTAAYMSPEQAKGKTVDKRSDVWAFGAVLYEMLTARRAFDGEDVSETMALILMKEPDWTALPPELPAAVGSVIRRCLTKDRKQRLRDVGDAALALEGAFETNAITSSASPGSRGGRLAWIVAVTALAALAASSYYSYSRQPTPSPDRSRVVAQIAAPLDVISAFENGFALSPDGSTIAFAARNKSGLSRIWLRRIDSDDAHEVIGTDGGGDPFWAPDGRTFGFLVNGALKRVDIDGGKLQTICDTSGNFVFGSWSINNEIVWGSVNGTRVRIYKAPAAGGTAVVLEALGAAQHPIWLSNGQRFIYASLAQADRPELRLASADGQSSTAIPSAPLTRWDYSYGGGFIFLNRNGTLTAQRLDEASGEMVGPAVPIAPIVGIPGTWFAVSSSGDRVIALVDAGPGDPNGANAAAHLVWVDRQGNQVGTLGEPASYWQLRVAPDGKSALVATSWDFQWIRPDLPPLRVTTDGVTKPNLSPVWHHGGSEFVYQRGSTIMRRPIDPQGKASAVVENVNGRVEDWSRDGRWLLFTDVTGHSTTDDLIVYDLVTKTQRPWLATAFQEHFARFSPDGKWVAYASDVSGRLEIQLRAFEGEGQPVTVSAGGGTHPFWRDDGQELFYLGPADEVMSVSLTRSGAAMVPGKPKQLFRIPLNAIATGMFPPYGVSPDGQRFLLNLPGRPAPLFLLHGLGSIVK